MYCFRLPGCVKLPSLPEGEITTIEIHRSNPYVELGISIVGGNETPLINIVIQEVYRDGVIARDGRLLAGDQILQVRKASLPSQIGLKVPLVMFQMFLDLYNHIVFFKKPQFATLQFKRSGEFLSLKLLLTFFRPRNELCAQPVRLSSSYFP